MGDRSYRKKDLDDEIRDVKRAYTKMLSKPGESNEHQEQNLHIIAQIKKYLVRLLGLKKSD